MFIINADLINYHSIKYSYYIENSTLISVTNNIYEEFEVLIFAECVFSVTISITMKFRSNSSEKMGWLNIRATNL